MAVVSVICPYCKDDKVIKFGITTNGKQRYVCKSVVCGRRSFLNSYQYNGRKPEVKNTIIDMILNGSGIRDTARVLKISINTVLDTLKKKKAA